MSFCSRVKQELSKLPPARTCCAVAESYGVLLFCNTFSPNAIRIVTESRDFAQRLPKLFQKAFGLQFDQLPEDGPGKQIFSMEDPKKIHRIYDIFDLEAATTVALQVNLGILEEECCRASFLRGAFMAGALFSYTFRSKGPLELKFLSLANGFFVPVFFMRVGLEFRLDMALQSNWGMLAILFISMFVVRLAACSVFWKASQRGWEAHFKESLAAALILSAPLTLLVVFGNLGLKMGIITQSFNAAVILLAVVSSIVWPSLFKALIPHLAKREEGRT